MLRILRIAFIIHHVLQFTKASKYHEGIVVNITFTENAKLGKLNYFTEFSLPASSVSTIGLDLGQWEHLDDFGFAVLQVHSHLETIKVFTDPKNDQIGTNLGFITANSATYFVHNSNHANVTVAVAIVLYNSEAPLPGGCNSNKNLRKFPRLNVFTSDSMIQVDTPTASGYWNKSFSSNLCHEDKLTYEPYYKYFSKYDYSSKTYFGEIKNMIELTTIKNKALLARKFHLNLSYRRTYIAVPGVGMIFNTVIRNSKNITAAYIPAVTYSCMPLLWENDCDIISRANGWIAVSWILIAVGVIKTFLCFDIPFATLFVDSLPIGAYLTYNIQYHLGLNNDISLVLIIVGAIVFAIVMCSFGGFFKVEAVLRWVATLISGWLLSAFTLYFLSGSVVFSVDFVYWFAFGIIMVIYVAAFFIVFRLLSILIYVSLGAFAITIGAAIQTKSHLLQILMDHFNHIQVKDYGFANGTPLSLSSSDIWLIILMVVIIIAGIIFQTKKLIRCRKLRPEVEPLLNEPFTGGSYITRWTSGSDDVFESPQTNYRFFRRLSGNRRYLRFDSAQ